MAFELYQLSRLQSPTVRAEVINQTSMRITRNDVEFAETYELFLNDVSQGMIGREYVATGLTAGTAYKIHLVAHKDGVTSTSTAINRTTFPTIDGVPAPFISTRVFSTVATITASLPGLSPTYNVYLDGVLYTTTTAGQFDVDFGLGTHTIYVTATVGSETTAQSNTLTVEPNYGGIITSDGVALVSSDSKPLEAA